MRRIGGPPPAAVPHRLFGGYAFLLYVGSAVHFYCVFLHTPFTQISPPTDILYPALGRRRWNDGSDRPLFSPPVRMSSRVLCCTPRKPGRAMRVSGIHGDFPEEDREGTQAPAVRDRSPASRPDLHAWTASWSSRIQRVFSFKRSARCHPHGNSFQAEMSRLRRRNTQGIAWIMVS